jgi:hypothetical protein
MFVGAKHDLRQYGIITNNLYAVMLLQASKTRCTQEEPSSKTRCTQEEDIHSNLFRHPYFTFKWILLSSILFPKKGGKKIKLLLGIEAESENNDYYTYDLAKKTVFHKTIGLANKTSMNKQGF